MQTENRLLDDLARLASSAMGAAAGLRAEIEARIKAELERILGELDHVPREEFEAVKAMAAKARAEQEILTERIVRLEAELARRSKPASPVGKRTRA
ncbi:MAG: accessory factor UbiK family protein [Proteobacteria bacterium]|nr:accessory factor UbiK family protein [Pseudomonadota bacterium]MBI3497641.1 accessory factor UbiK family protein [Pseudomonadota bacterium]